MNVPPSRRDRPPIPWWAGALLAPLFAREIARRNRRFDQGIGVTRLECPVISIGNLSVGGTGKTPFVMRTIELLQRLGRRPCIAMRGYRSRAGLSDEAAEYQRRFPDVAVVAQPDRTAGLRALFASRGEDRPDCVVLDDGFQHRRLARDLDLVLLDATRDLLPGTPHAHVLPRGWLREPPESLARASLLVGTHAESADVDALWARLPSAAARLPRISTSHEWATLAYDGPASLFQPSGQAENRAENHRPQPEPHPESGFTPHARFAKDMPVEWLRGRAVVAMCAIGNPGPFLRRLATATGRSPHALVFPDHHAYTVTDIQRAAQLARQHAAEAIVVTEKDWSKLVAFHATTWPAPVVRPRLQMTLAVADELRLVELLRSALAAQP